MTTVNINDCLEFIKSELSEAFLQTPLLDGKMFKFHIFRRTNIEQCYLKRTEVEGEFDLHIRPNVIKDYMYLQRHCNDTFSDSVLGGLTEAYATLIKKTVLQTKEELKKEVVGVEDLNVLVTKAMSKFAKIWLSHFAGHIMPFPVCLSAEQLYEVGLEVLSKDSEWSTDSLEVLQPQSYICGEKLYLFFTKRIILRKPVRERKPNCYGGYITVRAFDVKHLEPCDMKDITEAQYDFSICNGVLKCH